MALDMEQSKLLAQVKKRAKGTYDRIKQTEAMARGRSLPGNLKDAVGLITDAYLKQTDSGSLMLIVKASTIEPEEYKGLYCGFSYFLEDSQYQSFEDVMTQFVSDLKLIGLEHLVEEADDESSLIQVFIDHVKNHEHYFLFNTGRKADKNGNYRVFPNGAVEDQPTEKVAVEEATEAPKRKRGRPKKSETKSEETPKKKRGRPRKKKEPELPKPDFKPGDVVKIDADFFEDGIEYEGQIVEVKDEECLVRFDDDTEYDIPLTKMTLATVGGSDDLPFEEGDLVRYDGRQLEVVTFDKESVVLYDEEDDSEITVKITEIEIIPD